MKKITLIVSLVCSCLFMSFTFRGCPGISIIFILNELSEITFSPFFEKEGTIENFGIAIGNNGVILRSSGRDTINFQLKVSGTTQNLNGLKIQPTSYQPLVTAVGNNGVITRSTDQGETWTVSPAVTSSNLYAVDISGGVQFAAGDNGVILISWNHGATWSIQQSGTTRNLKGIGTTGGPVVAVGEKGTILRTTNSGQNWINVSLPDTTINLYCVSQKTRQNFNATNFYIAGSQGKIYKSTDNGATWLLKNSGTTNTLRSIFFSGNDSGAVSGDNGTVRMTTNGGDTWFTDPYFNNVTGNITSISQMPRSSRTLTALSNNNTLYIASEDSNIVIIGINQLSSEVPNEFSLSQNYPNPFNPNTNIRLHLNKSGFVKLLVYDISGKEVETLVSQVLKAGIYEVDWNGSRHSSGVYFYKVITDDFIQTKKMVLVK